MYAWPNLVNMSSSERKVSMRRPRSSGMTLRIFVRTSLIMEYRLSRGRSMKPDGIITGAVREFVRSRNPDRLLPRTPEPIGDTPRPAADAVQTGALRHGRAAAGEEPLSELGGGATVGPAHLAEQKSRQRPGPMSRDHRGGEIDQVRFAAGAGQDVVPVQIAVRHAARVDIVQEAVQAVEEVGLQLPPPVRGQAPARDVLERDRLPVDPGHEGGGAADPGQCAIGAPLAVELPRTEEPAHGPGTGGDVLQDDGAPVDLDQVHDRLGEVPSDVQTAARERSESFTGQHNRRVVVGPGRRPCVLSAKGHVRCPVSGYGKINILFCRRRIAQERRWPRRSRPPPRSRSRSSVRGAGPSPTSSAWRTRVTAPS